MPEGATPEIIEREIAELSQAIEVKRRALAAERGLLDERELVKETVKEKFLPPAPATETKPAAAPAQTPRHYWEALDENTAALVNDLIEAIPRHGLRRVINDAQKLDPFALDAFHDALIDKLYAELKERGLLR